ncbi:hypothetical protein BaRGS_00019001 [Batillaria attramentaria]|uniref:Uncharacterized protein n=1 Tax=Batillaria attramentaria TaxID=370345 RepID=A0ABD0KSF6_9CAEN
MRTLASISNLLQYFPAECCRCYVTCDTAESEYNYVMIITCISVMLSVALFSCVRVDLTSDIGFHLINLQGCLYVMSSEVSALFWEDDILGSMLKQSNFNVSKLVVTRDQYPALFQELLSLPLILEIFGNASPAITELSEAILDIAKNFDPSDPYWKGHDEETVSLSQKSESTTDQDTDLDDILTMEELQMALRSLQILRKRILKRMTVEAVCTPSDITELEDTESNIKQTQALINTLQQSSASDVKLTPNGSVASSGKSAKISSASGDIPACTVKMNVVAPMVQEKVTPALPIQEQTSVAQMAATNRQMEEIIKQQDQMLQSMLMMGWNPRLLNPGSASATPTALPMAASSLGLGSLGMRGILEQPQIRSQIPAVLMGSGVPGTSDLHLPGMHPSVPVGNPPGLRMPTPPPPSSAPHGQVRAPGVGIPPPPGNPAALRMPSLLRPPVCSSLGYPLPVPPMYAQPLSPLQTSPLGALGTQSADGGSLGAPVMKGQAGLESGAGGQGFGSLQLPVAGSGSSLTQGELLPGLLPLLQSLKASCSVRPQVPSSSSQSRADNVQQ